MKFLRLPGRFLIQNTAGEFAEVGEQSGVINSEYSISPLSADFNQDGYPDIVHANIAGRSAAFISQGGDANFLKVKLPNTVGSIAAKIAVTRKDGQAIYRDFVSGEGLCSDQSHIQIFGLGSSSVTSVVVRYIDGREVSQVGDFSNETVSFAD